MPGTSNGVKSSSPQSQSLAVPSLLTAVGRRGAGQDTEGAGQDTEGGRVQRGAGQDTEGERVRLQRGAGQVTEGGGSGYRGGAGQDTVQRELYTVKNGSLL